MTDVNADLVEQLARMSGIAIRAEEREDAAIRLSEMLAFHQQIPVEPHRFVNPDTHFDPAWPTDGEVKP